MSNPTEKKLLYEIAIIRPIAIFLIVVYHSVAIYEGKWSMPDGIHSVSAYYWISRFISIPLIEIITMMAGYVFSYQSHHLGKHYRFGPFVWKKVQHLLIPCWIFSLIYWFCFLSSTPDLHLGREVLRILSGTGHLWFLPMLFWCFVGLWIIDHKQCQSGWLLAALAVLTLLPIPSRVPLGLSWFSRYLFYGYLGYMLYAYKPQILARQYTQWRYIIPLAIAYVGLVIATDRLPNPREATPFVEHVIRIELDFAARLVESCIGIMALYLLTLRMVERPGYHLSAWIINLSAVCYGVYVFQQFILRALYYYTPLPQLCGSYWLPWCGFLIALVGSYLLAKGMLKTKTGKFLIG